jgi:transcriptional antiterminator Rof (Rho-off)
MRRSKLLLELHGGETVTGEAINLETKGGKELLLLITGHGERQVDLMQIDVLEFLSGGERISIS